MVPNLSDKGSQLKLCKGGSFGLDIGIVKKDHSSDYDNPTYDARLSCFLPEIQLAPSRRIYYPYKCGRTFPPATRLN